MFNQRKIVCLWFGCPYLFLLSVNKKETEGFWKFKLVANVRWYVLKRTQMTKLKCFFIIENGFVFLIHYLIIEQCSNQLTEYFTLMKF